MSLAVYLPSVDGGDIWDLPNSNLYFAEEIFSYTIQVSRIDYSMNQKASVTLTLSEVLCTRKRQSAPLRPFRVEREE